MRFVLQTQMATEVTRQPPKGNGSSEEEDVEEEEEKAAGNEVGKMLKAAVKELESALQVLYMQFRLAQLITFRKESLRVN